LWIALDKQDSDRVVLTSPVIEALLSRFFWYPPSLYLHPRLLHSRSRSKTELRSTACASAVATSPNKRFNSSADHSPLQWNSVGHTALVAWMSVISRHCSYPFFPCFSVQVFLFLASACSPFLLFS